MNAPDQVSREESRWPPALAISFWVFLMATLPGHVTALPVWISYLAAVTALLPMAAVALTAGNKVWLGIERAVIIMLATVYVGNTIAELADMIGAITLHPSGNNAFSLLSSSVAIWFANVLTFSLLYWQIDRGGPHARATHSNAKPDWVFPQPATPEDLPPDWRPLFLDYLGSWIQHGHGFQPHRLLAAHASRENVDDDRKHGSRS